MDGADISRCFFFQLNITSKCYRFIITFRSRKIQIWRRRRCAVTFRFPRWERYTTYS